MEAALNAVETAEMGYKKAAKEFGVPRNTLKRRHLGINKNAKGTSKILGSYTAVFSADIERELVQYILTMEATSAARAHGFNRQSVNRFFDLLTALVEEHNFPPDKIYNVDETGMTTVQTRPSKIIAMRGKRQVGALTSAERGTLVTT